MTINVVKKNGAFVYVDGDRDDLNVVSDFFAVQLPNYQYMPRYRASRGAWDGKLRLFSVSKKQLPHGLLGRLIKLCIKKEIEINIDPDCVQLNKVDEQEITDLLNDSNLPSNLQKRQYQYDGIIAALNYRRITLEAPTASGKSFLAYVTSLWTLPRIDGKILIVVPSTSLVEQLYSDFEEYGMDVDKHCARIYEKYPNKEPRQRIIISTWQSIFEMDKTWFHKFSMVIGDEAHGFKAKSLNFIMQNLINTEYRIGLTGTMPDKRIDKFAIEGHFGPRFEVASYGELIEDGYLNELDPIRQLIFEYPLIAKQQAKGLKYQEEIDFIISYAARNKYICDLAEELEGNTLILFQRVEKHGKVLHAMLKKLSKKKLYFVSGEIDTKKREEIRKLVKSQTGCIIIASMGTFSTGINIPNLDNLILTHPTKAKGLLLQMIGRVLRKSELSTKVFDIVDNLTKGKSPKNYSMEHGIERYRIYKSKGFAVKQEVVRIGT